VHWLLHVLGMDNLSGTAYGFWSGFGADIGEVVIIGGLVSIARRHNCHVHGCWRIGRHPVDGTGFVVCRRHHPDGAPTHEHVLRRHREHREKLAQAAPAAAATRKLARPAAGKGALWAADSGC